LSYYTVGLQQRAVAVLAPSSITKFYGAYAGQYTDEDAQGDICAALWQTNKDLGYVKCVLKTHGDLILSRWTKKSKDERGTLLSSEASVCFGQWPCPSYREAAQVYRVARLASGRIRRIISVLDHCCATFASALGLRTAILSTGLTE
jgi:hypothetical protein